MWWEQYGKDKMEQYLSAYQDLTGKSFFKHFWSKEDYDLYDIFSWLAELELLCPLSLLEEYLSECSSGREQADEKWVFMAKYLITYMKGLQTPKAVEMLFRIVEEIGISDKGLFGVEDLLLESVRMDAGSRRGYYGYDSSDFSGADLIRPFLSVEEHRQLFWILERHTFLNYPDKYTSFLIGVLSKKDHLLWFPKEEARKVFLAIAKTGCKKGMENLRKIYLTEEELEEHQLKKQEMEKRHLLSEQRKRIEAIRKDFNWRVAKSRSTDTRFTELYDYVERYCREREEKKEKCYITKRYLCCLFERTPCMLLERKEVGSLCNLLSFLFLKKELTFAEMKRILGCVEVKEERKEAA